MVMVPGRDRGRGSARARGSSPCIVPVAALGRLGRMPVPLPDCIARPSPMRSPGSHQPDHSHRSAWQNFPHPPPPPRRADERLCAPIPIHPPPSQRHAAGEPASAGTLPVPEADRVTRRVRANSTRTAPARASRRRSPCCPQSAVSAIDTVTAADDLGDHRTRVSPTTQTSRRSPAPKPRLHVLVMRVLGDSSCQASRPAPSMRAIPYVGGYHAAHANGHPVTRAVRVMRQAKVDLRPSHLSGSRRGGTRASATALGVDEHLVSDPHLRGRRPPIAGPNSCTATATVSDQEPRPPLGVKKVAPCTARGRHRQSGYGRRHIDVGLRPRHADLPRGPHRRPE